MTPKLLIASILLVSRALSNIIRLYLNIAEDNCEIRQFK